MASAFWSALSYPLNTRGFGTRGFRSGLDEEGYTRQAASITASMKPQWPKKRSYV